MTGARSANEPSPARGCLFFNFGNAYAQRLLVALDSLRRVYDGDVTTILTRDSTGLALQRPLERLGSKVAFVDRRVKASSRHRLFLESPYETTLVFDSDMIFMAPIDPLWEPLEREGLLVTRFYAPPHGVDGTPEDPGWANRVGLLEQVKGLVDRETYARALHRMIDERIDINVGVMGISRPAGDEFLLDWAQCMERGRSGSIELLDEMLTVALTARHRHCLAGEEWNCPADEFFRRTNLADAAVIHYFADGVRIRGMRLGRNPVTWAGKKWYEARARAATRVDLKAWSRTDPTFGGRLRRVFAHGTREASRRVARKISKRYAPTRKALVRRLVHSVAFPLHQGALTVLAGLGYRAVLDGEATATVVILSYKRMANIPRIVRSVLLCGFVDRVIVSNNNPNIDLREYLTIGDPRLELRQQRRHMPPSYRYDLARESTGDFFICIDDDMFPSPWQLRRLFASLVADPSVPRGLGANIYDERRRRFIEKRTSVWSHRDQTRPVDVVMQVHAFTRKHLEKYFDLVRRMNMDNASIHSSEDVIISRTGNGPPVLQDVGYVFKCITYRHPDVATHKREGFDEFRASLFHRTNDVAW